MDGRSRWACTLADLGARSKLAHLQKVNDLFVELDHENKSCVSADDVRKTFKKPYVQL